MRKERKTDDVGAADSHVHVSVVCGVNPQGVGAHAHVSSPDIEVALDEARGLADAAGIPVLVHQEQRTEDRSDDARHSYGQINWDKARCEWKPSGSAWGNKKYDA